MKAQFITVNLNNSYLSNNLTASDGPTNGFNVHATQLPSRGKHRGCGEFEPTPSVFAAHRAENTLNFMGRRLKQQASSHWFPMKAARTDHYPPVKPLATLNGGRSPGGCDKT